MLRVKIPQGILTGDQLDALADVGERYSRGFGHITTRQNVQFHFVKLHDVEPAMRRLADAGLTTRGSVRQLGAQHHRVPVRRRRRRRAVRRHAVRRGADAVSAAPSAQLDAAAQVQDRLRRLRDRSRGDGDQRSRLPRASSRPTAAAASACTAGGGTAIMVTVGRPAARVPAGVGDLARRGSGAARLRAAGRLPAQAAQPDEVHDQDARLDALARGVRPRADGVPPARPGADARDRSAGRRSEAGMGQGLVAVGRAHRGAGRRPDASPARHHAGDRAGLPGRRRGLRALARAPTCTPRSSSAIVMAVASVPLGDLTSEQMRVARRAGARLRRRHDPRHARSGSAVPVGERLRRAGSCIGASPPRGSASPRRARSPTSPAARARKPAASAVTQSRGLGRLLEDHLRARPDLIAAADGARIKISGCPNGCGLHHIATIGFQGSVRRLGSRRRAAVFRHGRRRRARSRRRVRPGRREDSGAPDPGDRRAAHRPLRPPATRPARRAAAYFGRVELDVVKRTLADPRAPAAGGRRAGRFHRPRGSRRLLAGSPSTASALRNRGRQAFGIGRLIA